MKIFTQNHKAAGEAAVRQMSEKAQRFYSETEPLSVYEYTDLEDNTWYAFDGCFGTNTGLTFEQIQQLLEGLQDAVDAVNKA